MTTNRQLEQFAHILSHDIKTHIRTISNFVGLLKKSTLAKFTEKEKTYFSFIDSGAKKLHDMVDNILEYSKLSSPKLNVSKIYLLEFIESIIFDLKVNLAEKKGEILIGKLPEYIMADRVKLRQVFQNLLSNAIKYTDSKTNPKIEIYAEEDAEHFEFYIKDNGIGIKAELLEKVFKPYMRFDKEIHFSGTGMGLSICKRIVEWHGGQIACFPVDEGGTCFHFSIANANTHV